MRIELQKDEYLSDKKNALPRANGVHLIKAGTGVGKTFHMMKQSEVHNHTVVFPQISIKRQQEMMAHINNQDVTICQLEYLTDDTKGLHIDEGQLIYEAGYRAEAIDNLIRIINKVRKFAPVYIYSGSFKTEYLNYRPFVMKDDVKIQSDELLSLDSITEVHKEVADRAVELYQCSGITNELIATVIKRNNQDPVLFFRDSHKRNLELSIELEKQGISCLCVNRDVVRDKQSAYQKLAESQMIGAVGVDVILATSALEEGLNIKDNVNIISIQTAPERLIQQFGRARDITKARYILLAGDGVENTSIEQCFERAERVDGAGFNKAVIRRDYGISDEVINIQSDSHRVGCMARSIEVNQLKKVSHGIAVVASLASYGYVVSDTYMYESNKPLSLHSVSKQKVVEYLKKYGELEQIEIRMSDELNLPVSLCKLAINRANAFKSQFTEMCATESNWLDAYNSITKSGVVMLNRLWNDKAEWKRYSEIVLSLYSSEKSCRINAHEMTKKAMHFWSSVVSADDTHWLLESDRAQTRLFRWLLGYKLDENNDVYILDKREWWNCSLTSGEMKKYNTRVKTIEQQGKVVQFHEHHKLDKREITKLKTRQIKTMCDEINWGV